MAAAVDRELLLPFAAELRGAQEDALRGHREERREAWHRFVAQDIASGGRRVFRWVRQPALQSPPPLLKVGGKLCGGPAVELAMAGPGWHALWAKEDVPDPGEQRLRQVVRALPPFPAPAPLTDAEAAAAIMALPLGKAPGPDGWAGEDLRLWPSTLVSGLASLLRAVEATGRWPQGLRAADVVLLPKPGGSVDEALQRRPTTLLPTVCRLWARLRLPVVDGWRGLWDTALADAPKGPDGQAWDLAWDLACAEPAAQAVAGLQLTWPNATIRSASPCSAGSWARQVGRQRSSARCSTRTHHNADFALVMLWAGSRSRGRAFRQAALWPLAVSALAALTWPWQVMVVEAGATVARRYVDDLTA